jgi:hypothetical protein
MLYGETSIVLKDEAAERRRKQVQAREQDDMYGGDED